MTGIAKAALAAAWMACGLAAALAAEEAKDDIQNNQWLKAGECLLFNAEAKPGDTVSWTGECSDGYASGLGTATFTHDGQTQSFTANFARGMIPDGGVVARWGDGWRYEGGMVGGRFHGAGVLTTDTKDRFEGQWTNGKMNGFGVMRRADGERYAGDWKDDMPNGAGELRHADGTQVSGNFVEGKLVEASDGEKAAAKPEEETQAKVAAATPSDKAPFGAVSGKTLAGVDGSSIALNLIEGGMELQVMPADGNARKTTFTFMNARMGTVVEDSGVSGAGTSVTGFFRLTAKGVEVRYADGRSAMLSSRDDGVQMALESEAGASCRSWYPVGHIFSEADKKAALSAYASRLGLPVAAGETGGGCSSAVAPVASNGAPPASSAPEKRADAKPIAKASYRIGDYKGLEAVAVRSSPVRAVDETPASVSETVAAAAPKAAELAAKTPDKDAASACLKVDSDGNNWGFRNGCGFAVQFSYCMAGGDGLAGCDKGGVAGSVAANGFGALSADNSLKESDAQHSFRWIACGGGAGEVVAHLDRFEPPAGRCERTRTAAAN